MRLAALLILALLAASGCDSVSDGTVDGVYVHSYERIIADTDVTVTVTFDIPPTAEGEFTLGPRSAVAARSEAGRSDSEELTGTGTVEGRTVTVTAASYPKVTAVGGDVGVFFDGFPAVAITGAVSAGGDRITFATDQVTFVLGDRTTAVFER